MKSNTYRLDRYISQYSEYSQADVRVLIAQKRIVLDGKPADSIAQRVTKFTHVVLDGVCLNDTQPAYIMLNKPAGIVSATQDQQHTTVLDLIEHPQKDELHLVGRLDFNTTGLVLLTNDGRWSRRISLPATKLPKTYEVTLAQPLRQEYEAVFAAGVYFAYENITTQPAQLEIVSDYCARLTLVEGKYHQVKRMFGVFDNEVTSLHRISVGPIRLGDLAPGATRPLSAEEVACVDIAEAANT
ncbi:pseudouridine synthase [Gilvimarinus agarilyticus]|uniref:pseudouridine synthase n=1 Tax=unclassified Gilvimarinus TaxID=2642066 RepID=UPI001C0A1B22|nr:MULTISPECIES: pseudouridine synthase [unclassified Gilvimarinus]MBU2886154.1 pseudouridine synthase [Gilvimarinus agarilyticus]MDO6570864.1 pseudouridine synthase [Gilvimarinus sp. 2_MG-2023]MDO6747032.1 pseudouridine synthase [Gilvimarinus sp. 1_MG-2023]